MKPLMTRFALMAFLCGVAVGQNSNANPATLEFHSPTLEFHSPPFDVHECGHTQPGDVLCLLPKPQPIHIRECGQASPGDTWCWEPPPLQTDSWISLNGLAIGVVGASKFTFCSSWPNSLETEQPDINVWVESDRSCHWFLFSYDDHSSSYSKPLVECDIADDDGPANCRLVGKHTLEEVVLSVVFKEARQREELRRVK
jgi:hypothetical protein